MKIRRIFCRAAAVCAMGMACSAVSGFSPTIHSADGPPPDGSAQAPPAAAALSGRWDLDRDLTDRPEQIAAAIRADFGSGGQEQRFGDLGDGRYGRGGKRGRSAPPSSGSDQEQNRRDQEQIDALTARLRYPPTQLTIAQSENSVTLTDAQTDARTLDVTGRKTKTVVGGATLEVMARYEGPQLVIEEDAGKGRTVTWTYAVLPATKQLLVRVSISRAPGELGAFEIKYVYDARTRSG